MAINRRGLLKGAAITAAGAAGTGALSVTASAAGIYGSTGKSILQNGVPVATALSPRVAGNLVAILNGSATSGSSYRVSNGRGIYRVSQSRVVATATTSATAAGLVSGLNKGAPVAPTVPGAPVLAAPITSTPGQVQLNWTAPASDGGSPITGYNVYIDGVLQ